MSNLVSERTKQRRRILRAAVGTPLVFSLPSGAAIADTSLSCKVKSHSLATSEPALGATSSPDKWVRFEVSAYRINQPGGHVRGFKLNDGLQDSWYRVNNDGTVSNITPNGNAVEQSEKFYLLVDYDSYIANKTNPIMYVYKGGDGISSPIAGTSCWNSISILGDEILSTVIRG